MKTEIKAEIVAHSVDPYGNELISVLATFPRIILAEVNTHRMLSKNTSSSRAIPFRKMVESVKNDPFIPIAWQKNHPGMQGTEYLSKTEKFCLTTFISSMSMTLGNMVNKNSVEYKSYLDKLQEKLAIISESLEEYLTQSKTLDEWWLLARDKAVEAASIMYVFDTTKQLCNRLLEPFMWTTMLITGNRFDGGWNNFFYLRCPSYRLESSKGDILFKSKKDYKDCLADQGFSYQIPKENWFILNKGQAEIHIMDLAEKIYDAVQDSSPRHLNPGDWHVPFGDKMEIPAIQKLSTTTGNQEMPITILYEEMDLLMVKVSVGMSARTSYTVVGEEKGLNYESMIGLHDRLLVQQPPHSSPMEHASQVPDKFTYQTHLKTGEPGWFGPYKGFMSYRFMIDNNLLKT